MDPVIIAAAFAGAVLLGGLLTTGFVVERAGVRESLRRLEGYQIQDVRDQEMLARQIEAELTASLAQGDAARGAVDSADKAVASAQEAYRVPEAQVNAGTATTTDLREAQSARTPARLNLTRAQYELVLSDVALAHATGTGGVAGL